MSLLVKRCHEVASGAEFDASRVRDAGVATLTTPVCPHKENCLTVILRWLKHLPTYVVHHSARSHVEDM